MAGVMAHNKAIVSSANARVRITVISVLCFRTAMDKFSLQIIMLGRPRQRISARDHSPKGLGEQPPVVVNPIEFLDENLVFLKNPLTLECVRGLVLRQSGSASRRICCNAPVRAALLNAIALVCWNFIDPATSLLREEVSIESGTMIPQPGLAVR